MVRGSPAVRTRRQLNSMDPARAEFKLFSRILGLSQYNFFWNNNDTLGLTNRIMEPFSICKPSTIWCLTSPPSVTSPGQRYESELLLFLICSLVLCPPPPPSPPHLLLLQTQVSLHRVMAFCLAELHLWSTKSSLRVKGSTYQHVQSPGDVPPTTTTTSSVSLSVIAHFVFAPPRHLACIHINNLPLSQHSLFSLSLHFFSSLFTLYRLNQRLISSKLSVVLLKNKSSFPFNVLSQILTYKQKFQWNCLFCLVKVWLVERSFFLFVFFCFPSVTYQSIFCFSSEMLWFPSFLFSPLFHSVSSFTVCWASDKDTVSRRPACLFLCVCVFVSVCTQGVYPRWWWQILSCLVFFFFLPHRMCVYLCVCVSSPAISEKCVWIRLCAKLLRCDTLLSPLSLHRTHLSRQHKEICETCVTADQQRTCV